MSSDAKRYYSYSQIREWRHALSEGDSVMMHVESLVDEGRMIRAGQSQLDMVAHATAARITLASGHVYERESGNKRSDGPDDMHRAHLLPANMDLAEREERRAVEKVFSSLASRIMHGASIEQVRELAQIGTDATRLADRG